jgi:hypothetical protein
VDGVRHLVVGLGDSGSNSFEFRTTRWCSKPRDWSSDFKLFGSYMDCDELDVPPRSSIYGSRSGATD